MNSLQLTSQVNMEQKLHHLGDLCIKCNFRKKLDFVHTNISLDHLPCISADTHQPCVYIF